MELQIDKLGKVSVTVEEDYWDINKDYDKLTIVEKEGTFGTYISRKPVPAGIVLTNRKYWIPFSSLKEEIVLKWNQLVADNETRLSEFVRQVQTAGEPNGMALLDSNGYILNKNLNFSNIRIQVIEEDSKTSFYDIPIILPTKEIQSYYEYYDGIGIGEFEEIESYELEEEDSI